MAIVTAIKSKTQSKTAMRKVIDYVLKPHKTNFNQPKVGLVYPLISGQNCVAETAFAEFMATKLNYGKDNGVFYKHFVQSFKPNETTTPQEIHQMAVELAGYFKGFEVLIATHIDADHWHSHFIVNSVCAETGLKIQFNEKNLNELRECSDEICKAHGLEVLEPYEKKSKAKGMGTREYRAAAKGESWKFQLMNAIDSAMEISPTKADFITNMEQMGYGVKWMDNHKYITYTTPEGKKCRDNKLHEEKYLKERMENEFRFRSFERTKSTEYSGKPKAISATSLRSSQRPMGSDFTDDVGQLEPVAGNESDNGFSSDTGGFERFRNENQTADNGSGKCHEQRYNEPVVTGWESTRNHGEVDEISLAGAFKAVGTDEIVSTKSGADNGRLLDIACGLAYLGGSFSEMNHDESDDNRQQIIERKGHKKKREHDRGMDLG
jgi:Relaxase/Mobilisation nuclease domain.